MIPEGAYFTQVLYLFIIMCKKIIECFGLMGKGECYMTHDEQRFYLIQELLSEDARLQDIEIPEDEQRQKDLLRSLMNVRPPKQIGKEFLRIQDEYLCWERDKAGVTDAELLPPLSSDERLVLWQGDITTLRVDAIVNAANSALRGCLYPLHSCIDNIVHSRTDIQLRLLCDAIMNRQGGGEPTGKAKITPAFNLPCKYILHTVGPIIYERVTKKDCELLASCYRSCLELAAGNGCRSIAFCCISTGEFHFPNKEAAQTAIAVVREFLDSDTRIEKVIFNVFKDKDLKIYEDLLGV